MKEFKKRNLVDFVPVKTEGKVIEKLYSFFVKNIPSTDFDYLEKTNTCYHFTISNEKLAKNIAAIESYMSTMSATEKDQAGKILEEIFYGNAGICRWCGSQTLYGPNYTYRSNCGCVSRSCECLECQELETDYLRKTYR